MIYDRLPKIHLIAGGKDNPKVTEYIKIQDGTAYVTDTFTAAIVNLIPWAEAFEGVNGYMHKYDYRELTRAKKDLEFTYTGGKVVAHEGTAQFKKGTLQNEVIRAAEVIEDGEFDFIFPDVTQAHPKLITGGAPPKACVNVVAYAANALVKLSTAFKGYILHFTHYEAFSGKHLASTVVELRLPGDSEMNKNITALIMPRRHGTQYAVIKDGNHVN